MICTYHGEFRYKFNKWIRIKKVILSRIQAVYKLHLLKFYANACYNKNEKGLPF